MNTLTTLPLSAICTSAQLAQNGTCFATFAATSPDNTLTITLNVQVTNSVCDLGDVLIISQPSS